MSKQAAMNMITGESSPAVNPSLVNPQPNGADPAPPVVEDPKDTLDSDRFAKIAQREAKLQKDRETFKSEQQKLYEEKNQLKSVQEKIQAFEKLRAENPIEAMKTLGFSEEDVFNYMASKPELTPEQKAELAGRQAAQKEIDDFKKLNAETEKKAAQERDDKAINAFKGEIGKSFKDKPDQYEYCNFNGPIAEELVYETVLEIMKEEKDILPHKALQEALDLVESYYEDEDKEMQAIKKRKKILGVEEKPVVEEPVKVNSKAAAKVAAKPVPTLTNKANVTAAGTQTKGESPSQKRERLENWLRTGVKG